MKGKTGRNAWIDLVTRLLNATTDDLRNGEWSVPVPYWEWVLRVQEVGHRLHGDKFRYIVHDLQQFAQSPIESRYRDRNGDLVYAAIPNVGPDPIIYSGTADRELVKFRLGIDLRSPFDTYEFVNPDTRWYNIASRIATWRNFPSHARQILDFFSELIARRLREGKRPLLIAKKDFLAPCAQGLTERLRERGLKGIEVVFQDLENADLSNPGIIPLINYGIVGTNLYEEFHAAYCLTGYYVNEPVVNSILQDILAPDFWIPIQIRTIGCPLRRWCGVRYCKDQFCDIELLAQAALNQMEMNVVLQAVGRVRPYTRPREIITFQCAAHPRLEYTREFQTLQEARSYFEIEKERDRSKAGTVGAVQAAKRAGLTQKETVLGTGLGLRTVKRYWNT